MMRAAAPLQRNQARHEQQLDLHRRRADPRAMRALLESADAFIRAAAKVYVAKFGRTSADVDDLISEGRIGAWRAANRFDPARGTAFLTYAAFWIRQAMDLWLRLNTRVIRVPKDLIGARAAAVIGDLDAATWEGANLLARLTRVDDISLDALVMQGDGNCHAVVEQLADPIDQEAQLLDDRLARLDAAMHVLDARERAVIRGRLAGKTRKVIARTVRRVNGDCGPLTRERVRQIEESAIAKLRDALGLAG
jgi:RNA polymerase sigma-32 factor